MGGIKNKKDEFVPPEVWERKVPKRKKPVYNAYKNKARSTKGTKGKKRTKPKGKRLKGSKRQSSIAKYR